MTETNWDQVGEILERFGNSLALGIQDWLDTLIRVVAVSEGDVSQVPLLHERGQGYGVALIAIARNIDELSDWSQAPESLDPRVILPLMRALGESYIVLLTIETAEDAARAPLVSLPDVSEMLAGGVQQWLVTNAKIEMVLNEG